MGRCEWDSSQYFSILPQYQSKRWRAKVFSMQKEAVVETPSDIEEDVTTVVIKAGVPEVNG